MIENYLINWGVLGVWTATLLYEKRAYQQRMKAIIENNTMALVRVTDAIKMCERTNNG